MAKLYFRYGTVGSAKTLNLLAVAHNYRQQGKRALLLKPSTDTRFGTQQVKSRAGLEMDADVVVTPSSDLLSLSFEGIHCILVDEAQFLSAHHVEQLRAISLQHSVPVICYGLRTDFRSRLFPGAARLMELADSIEEVKSTCFHCTRKSTMNLKRVEGKACLSGPTIEMGAEETFLPACYRCYTAEIQEAPKDLHSQSARASVS